MGLLLSPLSGLRDAEELENVLCLHLAPLAGQNAVHPPVQQLARIRPVRYHVGKSLHQMIWSIPDLGAQLNTDGIGVEAPALGMFLIRPCSLLLPPSFLLPRFENSQNVEVLGRGLWDLKRLERTKRWNVWNVWNRINSDNGLNDLNGALAVESFGKLRTGYLNVLDGPP
jgi:hypothetical protein